MPEEREKKWKRGKREERGKKEEKYQEGKTTKRKTYTNTVIEKEKVSAVQREQHNDRGSSRQQQ